MNNILLVTVTQLEAQTVIDVFKQATGKKREPQRINGKTYHQLGTIGDANVTMVQSEMGAASPGGALMTVTNAIVEIEPTAIIMVGVAFGVLPRKQELGDILVSRAITSYEFGKTEIKVIRSGERVPASPSLIDLARSTTLDWTGARVHFGLILSGEKLVNNLKLRDELTKQIPEAIGGEMEGAGLYTAANKSNVDWILVKGICDWVDETKTDYVQPLAAQNATRFVLAMIQHLTSSTISSGIYSTAQTSDSGSGQIPPDLPPDTSTSEPSSSEPSVKLPEVISRFTIQDDALEKHAATDQPIQSVKQDKLDFKIYVNALHSFILSNYTTTPITISIDGVWGTGKSSLMSMLKGKLDPQRDGVRKFFEWWGLVLPRLKWYWRFIWSSLPKAYSKALIALTVRNDLEDSDVHLYVGDKTQAFKKHVSNILEGFAVDPEFLNQDESKSMDKNVRWWAQINANCEPMEPPYHYTVWLNAWKFDNQEEVWASLALATMEQIKQKHGLLWRLRFWWELTFSRFSFWSGMWQVVKQFLLPLLFAIVATYYNTIMGSFDVQLDAFNQYGSPLLWTGALISGILSILSIFRDPFQIPLDKVFDRPNYKDKVKFLAHFENDFARIVRAATRNGFGWKRSKLVIFIDDLDRCEPPKSADIVEAVNLFLDAEGCVFIIGMDSESVARSIEVKYKDLFERIKTENTGAGSLGRMFLDKIVQIPFSVPRATPQQITSMVNDALGAKELSVSVNISIGGGSISTSTSSSGTPIVDTTSGQVVGIHTEDQKENIPPITQPRIDAASYAKPEVRAAILKGTELLADNPRQVKTFINLFRLSIYIANERKILEEKIVAEQTSGLNLEMLAIWTACSVRWQNLIRHLHTEAQINLLRNFLYSLSMIIQPSFTWAEPYKIPDEVKTDYKNWREDEKGSESHWCYLPWEWWLLEPDFLKTIKSMQDLWSLPPEGEIDWLNVLLTMTKPIA